MKNCLVDCRAILACCQAWFWLPERLNTLFRVVAGVPTGWVYTFRLPMLAPYMLYQRVRQLPAVGSNTCDLSLALSAGFLGDDAST
ncbi:hypothetical protein DPMN_011737 [Dreissena polymorpha]|uniref:Uncharacterized protein n=1 Tax=Dreissena polymorpha TaxID=45954 RepID=A0A9D4N159_DREPO|nr:hypothetical protein DPMN_011737 [Dreissena polymorpha]